MLTDDLYKSLTQFVLFLVALACVVIIIIGIQSFAYIINSILLATVITIAVIPKTDSKGDEALPGAHHLPGRDSCRARRHLPPGL